MENVIVVYGRNEVEYEKEKNLIEQNVGACYVLDNADVKLCQYIEYLHDTLAIRNSILYRLHLCKQIILAGNVTYIAQPDGGQEAGQPAQPRNMVELLKLLSPGRRASLVFENNDRALLANVLQQLIYIDYPITKLNLMLRSEFGQIARTQKFMDRLDELAHAVDHALNELKNSKDQLADEERVEDLATVCDAIETYENIGKKIAKARDVEMKIAVAASKKTGKSVIVNCMLAQQLAPTSLEMATPNTCIYRKSEDDKFHINILEKGKGEIIIKTPIGKPCSTREEVFEIIKTEFRKAQDDSENHFKIPDMEIAYVSERGNFDSYTIFDTPGPDAAGTSHREAADVALKKCDAAIFAIDYSKYLTETEESYLKKIKKNFAEQQKFHSLLFDINKMDLALGDTGDSQSRLKSIDFIRNRLNDIDEAYKDCVIFATSAQDYFYTCELENYARKDARLQKLLRDDADWSTDLQKIKKEIKDENGDEKLVHLLSNLQTEATRIEDLLGFSPVNLQKMRQYSGIPQLLAYARYVMQSKARDEIVNSITYSIAQQSEKLRSIIDKSSNIRALMGKSQAEIEKIGKILHEYRAEVENILQSKLTEKDKKVVEGNFGTNSFFRSSLAKQEKEGKTFPLKIDSALSEIKRSIEADYNERGIFREIWEGFSKEQRTHLERLQDKIVAQEDLIIPENTRKKIVQNVLEKHRDEPIPTARKNIEDVRKCLTFVLGGRQVRVKQCTEQCKRELEKDCELIFPQMPTWEVSIPDVSLPEMKKDFLLKTTQVEFNFDTLSGLRQWFRNWWDDKPGRKEFKVPEMSQATIREKVEGLRDALEKALEDADVPVYFRKLYESLGNNVQEAGKKIISEFQNMNAACKKNIEIFASVIDDRETFAEKVRNYEQKLEVCSQVENASAAFLNIWNSLSETEENSMDTGKGGQA